MTDESKQGTEITGEAWQVRSYQRQRLLKGLMRKVYDQEDASENESFLLALVAALVKYLRGKQNGVQDLKVEGEEEKFFYEVILPAITEFARTEAEGDVLIANLLKEILDLGLSPFYGKLNRQEIEVPEKVFDTSPLSAKPSAMDKVTVTIEGGQQGSLP